MIAFDARDRLAARAMRGRAASRRPSDRSGRSILRLVGADPDRHVVRRAPGRAWRRRAGGTRRRTRSGSRVDTSQMPRMTSIASSRALHRLAGGQPVAAHRLDRIPEAAGAERELEAAAREQVEADAAARATTAGGRSGTLSTFGGDADPLGRARATHDIRVQVSRNRGWYGWSWKVTRSKPSSSRAGQPARPVAAGSAFDGRDEGAEFEGMTVVRHPPRLGADDLARWFGGRLELDGVLLLRAHERDPARISTPPSSCRRSALRPAGATRRTTPRPPRAGRRTTRGGTQHSAPR